MTPDEDYEKEVRCTYDGRNYLVRDNGAIFRIARNPSRMSKWDEVWTFGVKAQNGYKFLGGTVRVHRVVCTAFYGPAPRPDMVVDHKDTNRCNNRPENLQWVYRLENSLKNPNTRRRIIFHCGSIEAFIRNPSLLRDKVAQTDTSWMRPVTKDEAEACLAHLKEWEQMDEMAKSSSGEGIGEWIFQPKNRGRSISSFSISPHSELDDYYRKQCNSPMWECRVLNHTEAALFPSAPSVSTSESSVIEEYAQNLQPGTDYILSRYYKLIVSEVKSFDGGSKLRILAERTPAQSIGWYVFEIWTDGEALYHKKIGSFGKRKINLALDALNDSSLTEREETGVSYSYYCKEEKGHLQIAEKQDFKDFRLNQ